MSKINRGSEWNKWDLHIHTPASYHWNDGKKFQDMTEEEKNASVKHIIEQLNSSDVSAFSIMDYFTFDGFFAVRKYLKDHPETRFNKSLFAGIEIRIEAPVNFRLNIHAIFSEDITIQELDDFKSTLKIFGSSRQLSREAIVEAGKNLPPDKAKAHIGEQDYKNDDNVAFRLGIETIKITIESFEEAVKKLTKEKCLVILPYDTSDGISKLDWKKHSHEACYFFQLADIFEARNSENINLILNIKTKENSAFIDNFFLTMGSKSKPVISGSDAHKIADYGCYPGSKITWIKADLTFRGLRKTLVEPLARTYIGERPEKLKSIDYKATKFISKVEINKLPDEKLDEIWFNNTVHFNPELIAIIGNKGSGKSALADILGLLGNSRHEGAFSFLNEKKFRERQNYKAGKFAATIYWKSNDSQTRILSDGVDQSSVEYVKYIPQSYLEKLCNEITLEKSLFDRELKAVIFSHISDDQRLGFSTLDELIKYKTEEINRQIEFLRENLAGTLKEILINEEKLTDQYKQSIVNQVTVKQAELTAHQKAKPNEPVKPIKEDSADSENQKLLIELEQKQKQEQEINNIVMQKKRELENLYKKKATADKLLQKIDFIDQQYIQQTTSLSNIFDELNVNFYDVFSIKINKNPICLLINDIDISIAGINNDLNVDVEEGLICKLIQAQSRIKEISDCIDEPNRKYQAYLEELDIWNKTLESIKGDAHKPGTIGHLNLQLAEIQNIPVKLKNLEENRDQYVEQIFSMITALANFYQAFYQPVQDFVNSNPFADDTFKMSFNVSISDTGFRSQFFSKLNRSRAGSFCGIDESEKMLTKIFDKYDFNNMEDIKSFTREILNCLKLDCREDKKTPAKISAQVKDENVLDLYKFIFSLEYLAPKYSLKLNNKNLEQLSPGERGTLLLIFYLMVDKDDRPLILDQPEENLDNQTIFKVLVPCIKSAKEKRQIFLVTHNPNLAIVCDAEQIIVTSIDKTSKNAVEYHSGGIEDLQTNKKIIDILEGTYPAFNNRKSKYFKSK